MSEERKSREKRGYHHGNLREALIEAALKLIDEHGSDGVTLSEAARMAGVSPAAPYRHFKDRNSLMAAVAEQGFEAFAGQLEHASAKSNNGPMQKLLDIGEAYLDFARKAPSHYAAMFEAGIAHGSSPALSRESDRAFNVLRTAATEVHAILPPDRRAPALMIALHIWSMTHGIASLFLRGDTARRNLPVKPEELLESGVIIYLDGLGYSGQT
ncbi:TetR/AcrR family transcriptional regulator [Rhizobium sp. L1K21]|uniref:TetR/AcrR family transcriptional regulator n=1 Tax=Rhizobium sp. L1K21 TaxID=2954933 RepID=UPI00209387C0|nr:TetR/AcrR family transcriptional regulator [Rhizobium sp. L1K21]MCO6188148.1 TetR/AcrR family transcriptional regulator [Rhizobium sp. L1K21]